MAIGRYDAVEDEIHHGPGYFIQPVAVDPMDRGLNRVGNGLRVCRHCWLLRCGGVEGWRGGGVEGQSTQVLGGLRGKILTPRVWSNLRRYQTALFTSARCNLHHSRPIHTLLLQFVPAVGSMFATR